MQTFDRTEIEKINFINRFAAYCDRWGVFVYDIDGRMNTEFGLVTTGPTGAARPIGFGSHLALTGRTYNATDVCTAVQALNGRINRDEIKWGSVEATRGAYVWPADAQQTKVKDFLQIASSYGIQSMVVLGGSNPNYGYDIPAGYKGGLPLDADEVPGYANFCAYAVGQATACSKFEIWNEFNIGGFATTQEKTDNAGYDPALYINLVKAAYPAIKAVRPDAEVIIGTFPDPYWQNTPNSGWFDSIIGSDVVGYCDGFSIHHYNGFMRPEYWHDQLFHCIKKIRANAPTHKVYLSESGWYNGSDSGSITETEAAARYSRYPFLLRCLDLAATSFYDLTNDGSDTLKESNFGFYTQNLAAQKAQALTVKDALAHVNASTTAKHYSDPELMRRIVVMDTATGQRAACWAVNATGNANMTITASSSGTLSVQTMGGTTATQGISAGANNVSIALSDTAKVVYANVPITIVPK